ncbi:hypothetical protein BJP36_38970 [Moorena producens JHB]|uniref:Uncharacterized protein n=1 Tax=Moorena producens (strain JHB) TaxID=1454205 RepID=A0A9Q9UWN7_MOOP1|nr:hypothetical protein [Moorena producens]WAN70051.1 hypothetical protein BJP36_38970 [Moorena producens JHB]
MPSILTVGWSWQKAHTESEITVWEYVTEITDPSCLILAYSSRLALVEIT